MTKNFLFAGVSAVALTLAAGAAFADANNNTSDHNGTTNTVEFGTLTANSNVGNVDNTENNSNQNNNNSLNSNNSGQIGAFNKKADIDLFSIDASTNNSQNYTNSAEFKNNDAVTASVLGATIAASDVDFKPRDGFVEYQGNTIGAGAFFGSNGIMAVNQNTGINANNQQAITVSVGSVTVGGTAPAQGGL